MLALDGDHLDVARGALLEAAKICRKHALSEIIILAEAKQTFARTSLGEAIGEKAAKALIKGRVCRLPGGLKLRLESIRTLSRFEQCELVLGAYLSRKGRDALDTLEAARAIALLPWTEEEGKSWARTWNPTILGAMHWHVESSTVSPEVEDALSRLTNNINMSTGITHPSDKRFAKQIAGQIRKLSSSIHADDVRDWLVRNNWLPEDADAFIKLLR